MLRRQTFTFRNDCWKAETQNPVPRDGRVRNLAVAWVLGPCPLLGALFTVCGLWCSSCLLFAAHKSFWESVFTFDGTDEKKHEQRRLGEQGYVYTSAWVASPR